MSSSPWTEGSVLRECRAILKQADTSVSRGELDSTRVCAHSSWVTDSRNRPCNVRIVIDNTMGGEVESVIHELIHIALTRSLSQFNADLEETVVAAMEKVLFRRVSKSPYMMRAWRRMIASKLNAET